MTRHHFIHFVLTLLSLTVTTQCAPPHPPPPVVRAAYWPSWDVEFPPSAINTSLFTHIFYAFLMPSNQTFRFEISRPMAFALLNFTTILRLKNPPVKTLLSIGGGGEEQSVFANLSSSASSREAFINSSIEVARKFGFDGLDLDWEFPQSPKEMKYLGHLLKQWRYWVEIEAEATSRPPLLLTAAVYYSANLPRGNRRSYSTVAIKNYLDWINVMCFDYHGSWNTTETGAHAALFDPKTNLSSIYGLRSWIRAGVPPNKVVMGLPLYGRTWKLKDPNSHGLGATTVGVGPGQHGVLSFAQVEEFNWKNGATVEYDGTTVSMYSFVNTSWIGYDGIESTTTKIGFAQALGLRGYFFWAVSFDRNWTISTHASMAWKLQN